MPGFESNSIVPAGIQRAETKSSLESDSETEPRTPMKSLLSVSLLAAVVATGCIHTHETVVNDESRIPIEFENDAAGRIFYEALSRMPESGKHTEQKSEVSLPIVFSHERKVVRGPNTGFNQAARRCDTNQDGKITESEARIFGASVK